MKTQKGVRLRAYWVLDNLQVLVPNEYNLYDHQPARMMKVVRLIGRCKSSGEYSKMSLTGILLGNWRISASQRG
jgi:hypothetical protein